MSIVKVKDKYQVTIPMAVREQAGIEIGDIMEAKAEKGKITLTPKSLLDKRLALGLADIKAGRVSPTFNSAEEMIRYLHAEAKKYKKRQGG